MTSETKDNQCSITKEDWEISNKELDSLEGWNPEFEDTNLKIYSKQLFEDYDIYCYKFY